MGFIINNWSLSFGILGFPIGYTMREGFCLFNCMNDSLTIQSIVYWVLGLFILGMIINWFTKEQSNETGASV